MKNFRLISLMASSLFVISCSSTSSSGGGSFYTAADPTGSLDSETLNTDDIQTLDISRNGTLTLNFSNNTSGSDYLLILGSSTQSSTDGSFSLVSADESAEQLEALQLAAALTDQKSISNPQASDPAALLHDHMRSLEKTLAIAPPPENPFSSMKLAKTIQAVGDEKNFYALTSITSVGQYTQVSAKLRALSSRVALYVDSTVEADVPDEDLKALLLDFSTISLPRVENMFGEIPDTNNDGVVTVLMTCTVNRFASSSGFVTGYFNPADSFSGDGSNNQEIFYTLVPDPEGKCGGIQLTSEFTLKSLLPGVLAHELQHMISFYHHVKVNGGSTEYPWLNEALSHFAEDIGGFGDENNARVKIFFDAPGKTNLMPFSSPGLAERAAGYLFVRYLYEQSADGDAFIRSLIDTNLTGASNIVSSFNGADANFDDMPEFIHNWSLALALSETGSSDNPRWNYLPRQVDADTGHYTGACIRCGNTGDDRGTSLSGPSISTITTFPISSSFKSSSVQFLRLSQPSTSLTLTTTSQGAIKGALLPIED